MINDESLIQEFLSEAREHLTSIEPDFLTMEQDGKKTDPEVLNRIFRAIHSIKGASGFFGFEAIKQLSHAMENVLMLIRDGKLQPSTIVVTNLLAGTDLLSAMIADIAASEQIPYANVAKILNELANPEVSKPLSTSQESTDPEATNCFITLEPSTQELETTARRGHSIYAARFESPQDLQDKKRGVQEILQIVGLIGQCLRHAEQSDSESLCQQADNDTGTNFLVMLSSILELDLIAIALDIPQEQITAFELPPKQTDEAECNFVESGTLVGDVGMEPENAAVIVTPNQTTTPTVIESQTLKRSKPTGGESVETIRVRIDLLNNLMNLAGELVLLRNQLLRIQKDDGSQDEGLNNTLQNLNHTTTNIQEAIMQTRMQPIGNILSRFRRLVRDAAQQLHKQIELEIIGEEVELDKSMLEGLSDPLTHIIRNSCDHGIELPEVRKVAGKCEIGKVLIHTYHEGGQINLLIEDDGQGIDPQKVAKKAMQLGLVTPLQVERFSSKDLINLIMLPGFSTAEQISDLSGRGVGMDVVRTNIEKLGGSISIDSRPGQGSRLLLKLPLTLAIIPSLIVGVAQYHFAIPQLNLVELICVHPGEVIQRIEKIGHAVVLRLRGRLLPLVRLADVLEIDRYYVAPPADTLELECREAIADRRSANPDNTFEGTPRGPQRRQNGLKALYIAILNIGVNQYGLIVDQVFNLEEIVIKPLPAVLKSCPVFSGSTIMGDGKVAMILDAMGLAEFAQLSFSEANAENQQRNTLKGNDAHMAQDGQSILLFNYAPSETFALPLSAILRIEKLKMSQIQGMGQQEYLLYQGRGLPLVRLSSLYPVQPMPSSLEDGYLIIPHIEGYEFGIIVSRILDTIQVCAELQPVFDGCQPGLLGAAIVNDRMTVFLDPPLLAQRSGLKDWRHEAHVAEHVSDKATVEIL